MTPLFLILLISCSWAESTFRYPWSFGISSLNLVYAEGGAIYGLRDSQTSPEDFDTRGIALLGTVGVARAKLSLGYADVSRHQQYLGWYILPHLGYQWQAFIKSGAGEDGTYGKVGTFGGIGAKLDFGFCSINVGYDRWLNVSGDAKYIDIGIGW